MELFLQFMTYLNAFMEQNVVMFIVTCIFILLDIISGLIVSFIKRSISSTVLRVRLGHKLGYIFIMCAVAILQIAMFDPSFNPGFDFPLFDLVCAFIILMELTSILENACILNPQLKSFIGKYFHKVNSAQDGQS